VARVFTARFVSFGDLTEADLPDKPGKNVPSDLDGLVGRINASRDELYGASARSLADLATRFNLVNGKVRGLTAAESASTGSEHTALGAILAEQRELVAAATRVVDFGNYEHTRRIFRGIFPNLAIAGAISAVAIGCYAFVVGSAPAEPPTIEHPVAMVLTLKSKLQARMGHECDLARVRAVAVAGNLKTPEVVTVMTSACNAVRLKVGARQGIAVPVVPVSGSDEAGDGPPFHRRGRWRQG